MFSILRNSSKTDESFTFEPTLPPFNHNRHNKLMRSACDNCRSSKLKCTGEAHGCQRCAAKNADCVYSMVSKHHKKQASDNTNEGSSVNSKSSRRVSRSEGRVSAGHTTPTSHSRGSVDKHAELPPNTLNLTTPPDSSDSSPAPDAVDSTTSQFLSDAQAWAWMDTIAGDEVTGGYLPTNLDSSFRPEMFSSFADDNMFLSSCADITSGTTDVIMHDDEPTTFSTTAPVAHNIRPTNSFTTPGATTIATTILPSSLSIDSSSSNNSISSCRCLSNALAVYESINLNLVWWPVDTSKAAIVKAADRIFKHQKRALAQCETLLECTSCTARSDFVMLIASSCGHIMTSLEMLFRCCGSLSSYRDQQTQQQQPEQSSSSGSSINNNMDPTQVTFSSGGDSSSSSSSSLTVLRTDRESIMSNADDMTNLRGSKKLLIRQWVLDDDDEAHMVKSLLQTRMAALDRLIGRLDRVVRLNAWSAHEDMIQSIMQRFHKVSLDFQQKLIDRFGSVA
ncbi:hypothetical protein F5Y17DRAFT_205573 [Xylariaceae sp. FL0594]|nr:hypothetical protein F5Y17DRAFT_205573 [Xylariaceae sp. FL0594]